MQSMLAAAAACGGGGLRIDMPEFQHINVKIFAREGSTSGTGRHLIPVFHRWIREQAIPELLIDVAITLMCRRARA